jgi:hypothetical protein
MVSRKDLKQLPSTSRIAKYLTLFEILRVINAVTSSLTEKVLYPEVNWVCARFKVCSPEVAWSDPQQTRMYMQFLEKKLYIESETDWYRISRKQV